MVTSRADSSVPQGSKAIGFGSMFDWTFFRLAAKLAA
jgi:hypothetical protein